MGFLEINHKNKDIEISVLVKDSDFLLQSTQLIFNNFIRYQFADYLGTIIAKCRSMGNNGALLRFISKVMIAGEKAVKEEL